MSTVFICDICNLLDAEPSGDACEECDREFCWDCVDKGFPTNRILCDDCYEALDEEDDV